MVNVAVQTGHVPLIVIVGGGASGTLTAIQLLNLADRRHAPLRIALIDRYGRHGMGPAYATADPGHLLNSVANQLSALPAEPDHLLNWARKAGMAVTPGDFLPRLVYGRYLRDTLAAAERAGGPIATLTRMTGRAVALTAAGLRRPLRVHLSNGGRLDSDAVVLATGSAPPAGWPQVRCGPYYLPDPWAPGALAQINDGTPVLVVGTGLTMVDVAATVTAAHQDTVVYAVSRHGLLPRRHHLRPYLTAPPVELCLPGGNPSLAELVGAVRRAVRRNGGEWPAVVEALRPRIPELWAGLSIDERRRFLNLVARYWEIHRHRIPPATAERLAALRDSGRLRLLRGRVVSAVAWEAGLCAHVDDGTGPGRDLRVGWLVNATGQASDIGRTTDPFLAHLFASGMAQPDALRLGLAAAADGRVIDAVGQAHQRIFTLGPTLRGTRYETTAIPEIRAQAAALAPRLLEVAAARTGTEISVTRPASAPTAAVAAAGRHDTP